MLTFEEARRRVIEQVARMRGPRTSASVSVWDALALVLAEEVKTDREYPPFDRSTCDGYAVRSKEVQAGARLECAGDIKVGGRGRHALAAGPCVMFMTG